jgi:bifunctional non-homologous end joining protein LigD
VADFEALHSRLNDERATACAFDLLMLNGDDLRRKPFAERKAALRKLLGRSRKGIQYVENTEGDGEEMFQAACKLGLEGIVSKRIDAPYRSGPARSWLKIRNPKAPAATRVEDGTF